MNQKIINTPTKDTNVGPKIYIEGNIEKQDNLWIVHQREPNGLIWPKEPIVTPNENGKFNMIAHEGGAPGNIYITLTKVSDEDTTFFAQWLSKGHKTGNYPGISPSDLQYYKEFDTVRVKFKPDLNALRVFISYSHVDRKLAMELYKRLINSGIKLKPWFDEIDLLPGKRWEIEIKKEIKQSDVVLICLSNASIGKKGYLNKEIKIALEEAEKFPPDAVYIIPIKLTDCELPDQLTEYQWIDIREDSGFDKSVRSLHYKEEIEHFKQM
jgi:hypothetical protein